MTAEPIIWFDQPVPFRRRSGHRDVLPITALTTGYADDPIVAVETGHWFTDAGFFFLLRDLLQIAIPPATEQAWLDRLLRPPRPDALRAALDSYAEAFDLVHPELPAMQVRPSETARASKPQKSGRSRNQEATAEDADEEEIEPAGAQPLLRLFPDSPTANNDDKGTSFFGRLGDARPSIGAGLVLPLLYANMVLFPSPGGGHFALPTGIDSVKFAVVGDTLWRSLWANVHTADRTPPDRRAFPWLDPRWREQQLGKAPWFKEEANQVRVAGQAQIPMQRRHLLGSASADRCHMSGVDGSCFTTFERWPSGPLYSPVGFIPAWAAVRPSKRKGAAPDTFEYRRARHRMRFDDWLDIALGRQSNEGNEPGWSVPDAIQRFTARCDSVLDELESIGEMASSTGTAFRELPFRVEAVALVIDGKAAVASSRRALPLWRIGSARTETIAHRVAGVIQRLDKVAEALAQAAKSAVVLTAGARAEATPSALADALKARLEPFVLDLPRLHAAAADDLAAVALDDRVIERSIAVAAAIFDETFPILGVDKPSLAAARARSVLRGKLNKLSPNAGRE